MSFDVPGLEQTDQPVVAEEVLNAKSAAARAIPEICAAFGLV